MRERWDQQENLLLKMPSAEEELAEGLTPDGPEVPPGAQPEMAQPASTGGDGIPPTQEETINEVEDRAVHLDAICTSSSILLSSESPCTPVTLLLFKGRGLNVQFLLLLSFFAPTAYVSRADIPNGNPPKRKSEGPPRLRVRRRALTGAARRRRRREIRSVLSSVRPCVGTA